MPARVIDADVGFGELPYVALHACVGRGVHLAHRAMLLAFGVGQAKLDGEGLQRAVVFQEEQRPGGVYEVVLQLVDPVQVRHEVVVVV